MLLDRVVRSASKTISMALSTVNELYETCVMKKTTEILMDTSHLLHEFFYVAQSGKSTERARTNRYCNTFLPTSVRLLNAKSGRGKWRGGWGDTKGRSTIMSIVNTNVVVLCWVM